MNQKTDSAASPATPPTAPRKPRLSLLIATGFGLGYIPFAPGTFGSLAGLLLALLPSWLLNYGGVMVFNPATLDPLLLFECTLIVLTAALGVWSAGRAAEFLGKRDPQTVVMDEISGQQIALVLGSVLPVFIQRSQTLWYLNDGVGLLSTHTALNWKYLLLGFILFRVFDIWKPFPARQAESLPGGWGIMADDWIAAVYAALGLWIARAFGM
jgi:phosphatidylglycerophosphatase A